VENPDAVEINEEVSHGPLLKVGLEENFVPFDLAEFRVSLRRGHINETGLKTGHEQIV
jgi:hypothetical protein